MEPNFYDHEYLIIDEISYRFSPPERGQVVVFRYPLNPQEYFIKRVIGLPGEEIEIKGGRVWVYGPDKPEGFMLQEDYLPDDLLTYSQSGGESGQRVSIGLGQYYVLGDNRNASKDSRSFGPVNSSFITGKVLFRGWPFNRVMVFNSDYWPQYNY